MIAAHDITPHRYVSYYLCSAFLSLVLGSSRPHGCQTASAHCKKFNSPGISGTYLHVKSLFSCTQWNYFVGERQYNSSAFLYFSSTLALIVFIWAARERQSAYKIAVSLSHCEICLTIVWIMFITVATKRGAEHSCQCVVWF